MSEGRRVPKLRFLGFEGEWEERKLESLFEERHEYSIACDEYPRFSFTIEEGVIDPEERKTNKRDFLIKDEENKKYLITEFNDIIYNPANVVFGAIHRNKRGKGCLSPIYRIFVTSQNPVFMEYLVRRDSFIKAISQLTEGTVVKLRTLKPEAFLNIKVFIPAEMEEQNKIGTILSFVDDQIAKAQNELEKWIELKKGMLQKMFPKEGESVLEIRFPGYTDPWELRKFSEGVSEIGDGLHGTPTYSDCGNIYFINGNNLVDGKIVIGVETKKVDANQQSEADKCLDDTTILMSINGTIGNLAYYSGEKLMLGKSAAYIKVSEFDKRFVYAYLQAPSAQGYFMDNVTGTTIKNLGLKAIREMKMLIPQDVEEQKRIGEFFDNLDKLISLYQCECDKWKELKKGLLQQMFIA